MLRVDTILFSNVTTAIQRTAHLTGGSVRGLPGGNVIEGLKGINSFNAEMAEAQKEFHRGRLQSALARVRQMEMTFNGISGRWSGSVNAILTAARQGKMNLSLQKINEVKNAQAKMQQLTSPVNKTFRDLISALDHAAMSESRGEEVGDAESAVPSEVHHERESQDKTHDSVGQEKSDTAEIEFSGDETPNAGLPDTFAAKYEYDAKLTVRKSADGKAKVEPPLESGRFYFLAGADPPAVVRVREVHRRSVLVFDPRRSVEFALDAAELKRLIRSGIWTLRIRSQ